MDERKRLTAWLINCDEWLFRQKKRIERQSCRKRLCEIVDAAKGTHNEGRKALYFTNGYWEDGQWFTDTDRGPV